MDSFRRRIPVVRGRLAVGQATSASPLINGLHAARTPQTSESPIWRNGEFSSARRQGRDSTTLLVGADVLLEPDALLGDGLLVDDDLLGVQDDLVLVLGDRRAVDRVAAVGIGDRLALDADFLATDGDGLGDLFLDDVLLPESAAGTLRAIEDAVREAVEAPLSDDATVVVLVPSRSTPGA
jgi:hypothetical protein